MRVKINFYIARRSHGLYIINLVPTRIYECNNKIKKKYMTRNTEKKNSKILKIFKTINGFQKYYAKRRCNV